MISALLRLLTLFALALMPFSMAGAAASIPMAAPSVASHCDDHKEPTDNPATPKAHCAACSALPAVELPASVAEIRPVMLLASEVTPWVAERSPEMDDPPPKLS